MASHVPVDLDLLPRKHVAFVLCEAEVIVDGILEGPDSPLSIRAARGFTVTPAVRDAVVTVGVARVMEAFTVHDATRHVRPTGAVLAASVAKARTAMDLVLAHAEYQGRGSES